MIGCYFVVNGVQNNKPIIHAVNDLNGRRLKRFKRYYPLSNLTEVFRTKTSFINLIKADPSVWSLSGGDHALTEIAAVVPVNILNKMLSKNNLFERLSL